MAFLYHNMCNHETTSSFEQSFQHAGSCIVRMFAIVFVLSSWSSRLICIQHSKTLLSSLEVLRILPRTLLLLSSVGTKDHSRQRLFLFTAIDARYSYYIHVLSFPNFTFYFVALKSTVPQCTKWNLKISRVL